MSQETLETNKQLALFRLNTDTRKKLLLELDPQSLAHFSETCQDAHAFVFRHEKFNEFWFQLWKKLTGDQTVLSAAPNIRYIKKFFEVLPTKYNLKLYSDWEKLIQDFPHVAQLKVTAVAHNKLRRNISRDDTEMTRLDALIRSGNVSLVRSTLLSTPKLLRELLDLENQSLFHATAAKHMDMSLFLLNLNSSIRAPVLAWEPKGDAGNTQEWVTLRERFTNEYFIRFGSQLVFQEMLNQACADNHTALVLALLQHPGCEIHSPAPFNHALEHYNYPLFQALCSLPNLKFGKKDWCVETCKKLINLDRWQQLNEFVQASFNNCTQLNDAGISAFIEVLQWAATERMTKAFTALVKACPIPLVMRLFPMTEEYVMALYVNNQEFLKIVMETQQDLAPETRMGTLIIDELPAATQLDLKRVDNIRDLRFLMRDELRVLGNRYQNGKNIDLTTLFQNPNQGLALFDERGNPNTDLLKAAKKRENPALIQALETNPTAPKAVIEPPVFVAATVTTKSPGTHGNPVVVQQPLAATQPEVPNSDARFIQAKNILKQALQWYLDSPLIGHRLRATAFIATVDAVQTTAELELAIDTQIKIHQNENIKQSYARHHVPMHYPSLKGRYYTMLFDTKWKVTTFENQLGHVKSSLESYLDSKFIGHRERVVSLLKALNQVTTHDELAKVIRKQIELHEGNNAPKTYDTLQRHLHAMHRPQFKSRYYKLLQQLDSQLNPSKSHYQPPTYTPGCRP